MPLRFSAPESSRSRTASMKRRRRVTTTPLNNLVQSIIAWCDTGALTSADELSLGRDSKEDWLMRHLQDATVALGITSDDEVWLPGKTSGVPLLPALEDRFRSVIKEEGLI